MPTCDEDGPRIIDLQAAAADRARPFALVARTCARQAHEEWQEALKASVAAQAAARAAMGKPESAFLFDRAVAAHQNVRLAEGVYQRARDAWFRLDLDAKAKFMRRFRFEDCLTFEARP